MAYPGYILSLRQNYKTTYLLDRMLDIVPISKAFTLELNVGEYVYERLDGKVEITTPTGIHQTLYTYTEGQGDSPSYQVQVRLRESGIYKIRYSGTNIRMLGMDRDKESYAFTYSIGVVDNKLQLKKWTITDVINRLLEVAEPLRKGEKPRFRLNAEQAAKFDKILAPELSFTKQTLRECLQQIGGIIHGEPRLKPVKDEDGKWIYEISYDMYTKDQKTNLSYVPYSGKGQQLVIDSYLGWVDSTAENLINQLDKFSGVIVEPYENGAKSVRTESMYVRIEESNMLIPTQYPIYT